MLAFEGLNRHFLHLRLNFSTIADSLQSPFPVQKGRNNRCRFLVGKYLSIFISPADSSSESKVAFHLCQICHSLVKLKHFHLSCGDLRGLQLRKMKILEKFKCEIHLMSGVVVHDSLT